MLNTIPEERSSLILKKFCLFGFGSARPLHFAGFSLVLESRGCPLAVVLELCVAVASLVAQGTALELQ